MKKAQQAFEVNNFFHGVYFLSFKTCFYLYLNKFN
jgi:hypothetical protein